MCIYLYLMDASLEVNHLCVGCYTTDTMATSSWHPALGAAPLFASTALRTAAACVKFSFCLSFGKLLVNPTKATGMLYNIQWFLSISLFCKQLRKMQLVYHKIHLLKMCNSVVSLVYLQGCANTSIEFQNICMTPKRNPISSHFPFSLSPSGPWKPLVHFSSNAHACSVSFIMFDFLWSYGL